jgi:hypothetical protein
MDKKGAKRQPIIALEKLSTARGLGVYSLDDKIYLLYQPQDGSKEQYQIAVSEDGLSFEKTEQKFSIAKEKGEKENIDSVSNFSIYNFGEELLLTYRKTTGKEELVEKAWAKTLQEDWNYEGSMLRFKEKGAIVGNFVNDKNSLCTPVESQLIFIIQRIWLNGKKALKYLRKEAKDLTEGTWKFLMF